MECRFGSPEANQRVIDLSRRAIERVIGELSKRGSFDAGATAGRALVTQSFRGARTAPPPERSVRVGTMSDAELARHVEKTHGYKPNF